MFKAGSIVKVNPNTEPALFGWVPLGQGRVVSVTTDILPCFVVQYDQHTYHTFVATELLPAGYDD